MKHRNIITAGLAITLLLSLAVVTFIPQAEASPDEGQVVSETEVPTTELPAEAETSTEETATGEETQEPKFLPNPQLAELGLDAPNSLDSNGSIPIPQDGTLLNIRLSENLGGEVLNAIAPGAFSGTNCLRSITLPSVISEIGENAFADCPGLAYIVLEGRCDLEGMTLGENWNGGAQVIFALIVEETPEVTEPAETESEETETAETESEETEPTETEPTETETTETETTETETTETETTETEPTETETTETETTETETTETESEETEAEETEPAVSEPTVPEPSETMSEETDPEESANPES